MQTLNAGPHTESVLFSTLLQLLVIVLVARIANIVLRRFGQPGATGEILAGLLLGPSFLGFLFPRLSHFVFTDLTALPMQIFSQIGLILLMFQIGSDFDFGHLKQQSNRSATLRIAAASVVLPLIVGWCVGQLSAPTLAPSANRQSYSLFLAVAMAITAVPILGRMLKEFKLTRTPLGVITISAAALNDVVGWSLLAIVSAVATTHFSLSAFTLQICGLFAFAAILRWIGFPFANFLLRRYPVRDGQVSATLMSMVLGLLLLMAICTYQLGIFAIFGGFAAGLLFHKQEAFVEAWRKQVGQFVLAFFLPIFFTYTGLKTNILGLTTISQWTWCVIIIVSASVAKIVPVYWAARSARIPRSESLACGLFMNTRALMELIVLNIGYDMGAIPKDVFTMMVLMALSTTLMAAPLVRAIYRRSGRFIPVGVEA